MVATGTFLLVCLGQHTFRQLFTAVQAEIGIGRVYGATVGAFHRIITYLFFS
ncbi:hypothetical protein FD09_GL001745 [Schleiferilactobacillus perolens DSM 12744]|uniref:Uncharacterized protein n=1 Tax=Schleiferilactobacillus perolens DSM 12744 TaxID=1423792 RepID=A0A0R1N052_9LACO|nr:hypothetical protein FD09_GL001745 [Schleiferilactobacillus perolens DSM 12744]